MDETYWCISWSLPLRPDVSMIPDESVFSCFMSGYASTPTAEDSPHSSNFFVGSGYAREEEMDTVACFISGEKEFVVSHALEEEFDLIASYYGEGDFLAVLLTASEEISTVNPSFS